MGSQRSGDGVTRSQAQRAADAFGSESTGGGASGTSHRTKKGRQDKATTKRRR